VDGAVTLPIQFLLVLPLGAKEILDVHISLVILINLQVIFAHLVITWDLNRLTMIVF